MKLKLSNRLYDFNSQGFKQIYNFRNTMVNPIDLSIGLPEDYTPNHIKNAGIEAIKNNHTEYSAANGLFDLRVAISNRLKTNNKIQIDENGVSIVPGLTTGLLIVYLTILSPGDEIIIIDPYYPPYKHIASIINACPIEVPTLPNFQPNIDLIKKSITNKTKAIIINTPNNPTGAIYDRETLSQIADIADSHGLFVISDEIYEKFTYAKEHFSIGSIYENTITMNGFSKEYSMTGWRLGYVAGSIDVINAINELLQYLVFSSNTISQHAALRALSKPTDLTKRYKSKRDLAIKELANIGYEINGADGAYYIFLQTPKNISDNKFIELAAKEELLLIPGHSFTNAANYFRLSYGINMKDLKEGLSRLRRVTNMV